MELIEAACEIALNAGKLLKKGFGNTFSIQSKEGKHNLVTDYDRISEEWIKKTIAEIFPSHGFLAEESFQGDLPSSDIIWIIDPLDGTVNFAHGIPHFAVSIAAYQKGKILCGAVYNPMLDELFTAEKGKGAYLNHKPIHVTKQSQFEDAFVATGFPYNAYQNPFHCIERFGKMVKQGLPIRRMGVAALDLAYVAAGRFDLFWEVGLQPWDMAAGKILIEEAGGKISLYDGTTHPILSYTTCLATNGHLHEKMVCLLKKDLP